MKASRQIRWRSAALVYLRGTVPPEHHMWRLSHDWNRFMVPLEFTIHRPKIFGEYWGPILGAIEGLLALHEPSPTAKGRVCTVSGVTPVLKATVDG
ncbi:hypothetical protein AB0P36_32685 [Streptomyces flavidovirens]|uniref:hypothetical protein n=1 Tax=Streptomyces flavidovirens TaxID=67298 RepID=UPI003433C065